MVLEYTMIPKYTTQGHMCMHSMPPQPSGQRVTNTYRADIPDVSVPNKKASDNCYQITKPPFLCTQVGVSPGIPHQTV